MERLYTLATVGFEAARKVDVLPPNHRSRRLHGHSFQARVRAALPAHWSDFPGAESDTLRAHLTACVAPLDYSLLNNHIDVPTDENLARWVRRNLDLPGNLLVGIQSTRDQGVDLDESGHAHIWRRFRFEAAHQLPNVPHGHKCGRMHGHGFEVILHSDQDVLDRDMGVDFDHIETCWGPLHGELHQACLNDLPGLENPTSEMLAAWIWARLQSKLPQLSWVTVYETSTAGCHYSGDVYRIWKEERFEAALRLSGAPPEDKRSGLHGHSYVIRLHLSAPLDEVMGWTVDYGDVKELFRPVYAQLDHHRLDAVRGLDGPETASVLSWVKAQILPRIPQLDRIDLLETPGCGGFLCWGLDGPALPT